MHNLPPRNKMVDESCSISVKPVFMWILVHAHTNKERIAQQSIEALGETPWLPLATDGDPAYPGYLFVKLGDSTKPREINKLNGVIRVVKYGETLATASDVLIDKLKQTEWTRQTLKPGDPVVITRGPFVHFKGRVKSKLDHIVDIVIEVMHRPQTLRLTTREVEPVG